MSNEKLNSRQAAVRRRTNARKSLLDALRADGASAHALTIARSIHSELDEQEEVLIGATEDVVASAILPFSELADKRLVAETRFWNGLSGIGSIFTAALAHPITQVLGHLTLFLHLCAMAGIPVTEKMLRTAGALYFSFMGIPTPQIPLDIAASGAGVPGVHETVHDPELREGDREGSESARHGRSETPAHTPAHTPAQPEGAEGEDKHGADAP